MHSRTWPYLYGTILLIHLLSIAFHIELLQAITKPLLMICLGSWFYLSSKVYKADSRFIMAALGFSLLGDLFLMLDSVKNNWFIAGIAAFLLAHIMYIIFFVHLRRINGVRRKSRAGWIALSIAYSGMLLFLIYPHTGSLGLPVIFYAVTITTMLVSVLLACSFNEEPGRYCISAAILFVISDSLLAINKFFLSFSMAPLMIMVSYGIAQFAFVKGSLQYLSEIKHSPAKP